MDLKSVSAVVDLGNESPCHIRVTVYRSGKITYCWIGSDYPEAECERINDVVDTDCMEKAQISNLIVDLQAILR